METLKFQNLIQLVTNRPFLINTIDTDIQTEKEYYIYYNTPIINWSAGFRWITPKTDEKMLKSFITSFTSKYREPNPLAYSGRYGRKWDDMDAKAREYAYMHHSSNMYNKKDLLKQIEDNFGKDGIANGLIKYGFYPTEYGIGIFCFWTTDSVRKAMAAMAYHLRSKAIPYTNEYSDARWVFRFKLGISKDAHTNILNQLNN